MNRRFLVVVNPASGRSSPQNLVDEIRNFFDRQGVAYEIFLTKPTPLLGLENWNQKRAAFSDVLAVGGDGTLNGVVNATIDSLLPVSVIPAGTGNDFIKNLHMPGDLEYLLKNAIGGKIKYVDAGKCNDRYFMNGVGIGFDGKVVEYMRRRQPKWNGHAAYRVAVMKLLLTFKEQRLHYIIDEQSYNGKTFSLTIANGTTFGGGFKIAPDARIDDGLLDVCLINPINLVNRFLKLPLLKDGSHKKIRQTQFFKAKTVKIPVNDLFVGHMDGEFIGKPPLEITVKPAKIPVRVSR